MDLGVPVLPAEETEMAVPPAVLSDVEGAVEYEPPAHGRQVLAPADSNDFCPE
jgi:hypothetical protein